MFRQKLPKELADMIGVGLSVLCVLHCLALPIVIVALPSMGFLFDTHWVHQVLIGIAAPVSLWAVVRSGLYRNLEVGGPMLAGLILLGLAAFLKAVEPFEGPISIVGAALLAFGHYRNTRLVHRLKRASGSGLATQ